MRVVTVCLLILSATLLIACTATPVASTQPTEGSPDNSETVAESIHIRLGIQPLASNLPLYIAQQEGFFAEQGLEVEFINFTSSPSEVLTALLLNEIDVTGSALVSAQFEAMRETPGIRIVADKGYLDPSACSNSALVARTEILESNQLDDLSNVENMVVSATLASQYSLYVMEILLEPAGLTIEDLQIVEMPLESRLNALETGAIDLAVFGEPYIALAEAQGVAKTWKGFEEIIPEGQVATLWFGPSLVLDNRDAGNRFMVAYLKAIRQYNEGKTDRNVELMAEFTGLELELARTSCWQGFRDDASINLDTIFGFQEWLVENDILESILPLEGFWDGGFVEYALSVVEDK